MTKVYLSSTFKDLSKHREAAAKALRKIRCEVIRMEEYVARDEHTKAGCEKDVDECDIYIGIFAWRYGYVPKQDNPEAMSITELEYRRAKGAKPCLVFLLAEKARWPEAMRDSKTGEGAGGERIHALRAELAGRLVGSFTTPDSLATEVIAAVYQLESERRVERLEVLDQIRKSVDLGPSYLANIQAKIVEVRDAEIVELSLGPTPWWTTRLHLVAALASDFTRIRQFVFLDAEGKFLSMASPTEVRRALTRRQPQLERAYLDSRPIVPPGGVAPANEVDLITMTYRDKVFQAFGSRLEPDVKEDVSPLLLTRELGIETSADAVEQRNGNRSAQQLEILSRSRPYVVLLDDGRLVSVIDRVRMASQIALGELDEHIR